MKLERNVVLEAVFWVIAAFLFFDKMLGAWYELADLPLTDQLAYPDVARSSRFFYDTSASVLVGTFEPLHIFFVKVALAFMDSDDRAIRAVGFFDALALFAAIVLWMRWKHGFVAAAVAALALWSNRWLAFYGVQGFNMSTYLLALAVFGIVADVRGESNARTGARLGAGAGMLALARLEGLAVACATFAATVVGGTGALVAKLRAIAIGALVALALVTPHFYWQWKSFGSPIQRLQNDARFWKSTEADHGQSDYDARVAGGPLTLRSYVFEGGVGILVGRVWAGYRAAITRYLPRLFSSSLWVLPLAAIGFFDLLRRCRWAVPALSIFVVLPFSFILSADQIGPGSGVEMRFVLPMLVPFFALCGAGADSVAAAASMLRERVRL